MRWPNTDLDFSAPANAADSRFDFIEQARTMEDHDVVVIGGGSAGLSTARGLAQVHRRTLLISSQQSRNCFVPAMHNVLFRDTENPRAFLATAKAHIEAYGFVDFVKASICFATAVPNEGVMGMERPMFEIQDSSGRAWRAKKLVLAIGVRDVYPDITGYEENWGTNMYAPPLASYHTKFLTEHQIQLPVLRRA